MLFNIRLHGSRLPNDSISGRPMLGSRLDDALFRKVASLGNKCWVQYKLSVRIELCALDSPELSNTSAHAVEIIHMHRVNLELRQMRCSVAFVPDINFYLHISFVVFALAHHDGHHFAFLTLDLLEEGRAGELLDIFGVQLCIREEK